MFLKEHILKVLKWSRTFYLFWWNVDWTFLTYSIIFNLKFLENYILKIHYMSLNCSKIFDTIKRMNIKQLVLRLFNEYDSYSILFFHDSILMKLSSGSNRILYDLIRLILNIAELVSILLGLCSNNTNPSL